MMTFLRTLFLLALLLATMASLSGYWIYEHKLQVAFPLVNELPYTVFPGTSLAQIAMDLMAKELLDYPSALTWVMLARYQNRAELIKTGDYLITVGMTPQEFLSFLVKGKTTASSPSQLHLIR